MTDTNNSMVRVFGSDFAYRSAWGGVGEGDAQLQAPVGIAAAQDGTVYVTDAGNGRLIRFKLPATP